MLYIILRCSGDDERMGRTMTFVVGCTVPSRLRERNRLYSAKFNCLGLYIARMRILEFSVHYVTRYIFIKEMKRELLSRM